MPKDQANFRQLLHSNFPIIIVETHDEQRVVDVLQGVIRKSYRHGPLYIWSAISGLQHSLEKSSSHWTVDGIDNKNGEESADTSAPEEALKHIKENIKSGIVLLPDFHTFLTNPIVVRMVKEIAHDHERNPVKLVLVSHAVDVPAEIRRLSAHFEISVPDEKKIKRLLAEEIKNWNSGDREGKIKSDRRTIDLLVQNLVGLTEADVRRLIHGAIYDDYAITASDIDSITQAKYRMLSDNSALRFEFDTNDFADIGGFGNLKSWLEIRRPFFIGEAELSADDIPRGLLLVGIQGCGKSLAAKAVAGAWGVPLLRFDMGALFNKYIGESERNVREALQLAEVLAPCVLWVDEIEKAISGQKDDTGTSSRILGTLLTWMAENTARVFVVATSNDIERLPPELMRKGRVDEIFFVDLPGEESRTAILELHANKRGLELSVEDKAALVSATDGFSGAEIEQAVVSACFRAHAQEGPPNRSHILAEIVQTRPLSVVRRETIDSLRAWAQDRTVSVD